MKQLIFFLLLIPFFSFAQEKDIPKFANQITVKNVSFKQVKQVLIDQNYFIDKESEENGQILTQAKGGIDKYKAFGQQLDRYHLIVMVRIKDSTAYITGQYSIKEYNIDHANIFESTRARDDWSVLLYWKAKGSVPHAIFMYMDKIADSLKSETSYQVVKN